MVLFLPSNVLAVVFHDDIDEVVNCGYQSRLVIRHPSRSKTCITLTIFISHKHFTVENLVVTQNVVDHPLIQTLRWLRESNLHATSTLDLEIDIPEHQSVIRN